MIATAASAHCSPMAKRMPVSPEHSAAAVIAVVVIGAVMVSIATTVEDFRADMSDWTSESSEWVDAYGSPDNANIRGSLERSIPVYADVDTFEDDAWYFYGAEGEWITIEALSMDGIVDTQLYLYDPNGKLIGRQYNLFDYFGPADAERVKKATDAVVVPEGRVLNSIVQLFAKPEELKVLEGADLLEVEDLHVFPLHLQDAIVLEAGEQAADGLQCETEIAADLLARHAEEEVGRRESTPPEAFGQAEEKGRDPLLGGAAAE